jgi:hypothetical protein
MTDVGLNVSIMEFMVETTRTVASGTTERFSKVNCSGLLKNCFPRLGKRSDATVSLRRVPPL